MPFNHRINCCRIDGTSSSNYLEGCKDLGVYNLENSRGSKRSRYLYPDTKVGNFINFNNGSNSLVEIHWSVPGTGTF